MAWRGGVWTGPVGQAGYGKVGLGVYWPSRVRSGVAGGVWTGAAQLGEDRQRGLAGMEQG